MAVRSPSIKYVTVVGRVFTSTDDDYKRLLNLGARFRNTVIEAIRMLYTGMSTDHVERVVTKMLNQGYAKSAVDTAKLIIKGTKYNGSNPLNSEINKLFIISKGTAHLKGNKNIRLISSDKLLVSYNFSGKGGRHNNWIECEAKFGDEYIPLIDELVSKALNRKISYTAKIIFRDGRIYLHLSIPTELYIKYFRKVDREPKGDNIASFDLNSDRINMVIIDKYGIIRDSKTEWFGEVNRPGYPKKKAWALRLQALGRLLRYAYHHSVSIVLFEDLDRIKRNNKKSVKEKSNNKNVNRKMNTFPKKKLLIHGILMAWKYGFKVYLVNPSYTSRIAGEIKDGFCLDRHTVSAYLLALKYLNLETFKKLSKKKFQRLLTQ